MQLSREQVTDFQQKILTWYSHNKRDLPWRNTRDPYTIFVSEIMSQQTQIQRVVTKYQAWIERFPTVKDLATATIADVLAYWSGLGYNRRALHLKKTAEIIRRDYKGKFPQEEEQLLKLPGIGIYTARAILCFAFDKQVAVVDTNIRKIIFTQLRSPQNPDSGDASLVRMTEKELLQIAEKLLPKGRAYEWNQALMDYAAAMLKKEKIPIPKQSKFIGSHRYYRGQVLKVLVAKKKVAIKDLGALVKKDFVSTEEEWLRMVLKELHDEGFIVFHNDIVRLSSE